jgi:DUF971 family protein/molybdopterin converting factor small subunit
MNDAPESITPIGIKLHKKSRLLEIGYSDDTSFMYPCEYLRISAPAATGGKTDGPVHGKQAVEITQIEPLGMEALRLDFDDGYSAVFSWAALHELGVNQECNWRDYLQALKDSGLGRGAGRATGADGRVTIKLLYFIQLAQLTGRDEEEVVIPDSVTNIETLLAWLCSRRQEWREAFTAEKVQVTVNRHFAEPFTLIEHGDEIAIVPRQQ